MLLHTYRYKNGDEVFADARVKIKKESIDTFSLNLDNCTVKDGGMYEAKVSNSLGDVSSQCTLTINSKYGYFSSSGEIANKL